MRKYAFKYGFVFLLIIIIFTTVMAFGKTEQQTYQVVQREKEFEIRFYPPSVMATVRMEVNSYSEMSGRGFRKLAGYIFGGNESETSIAMTAPVHMDFTGKGSSMSFVMPASWEIDKLPTPKDSGVVLENSKEEYVAAIRFGGYASDSVIQKQTARLQKLLEEKGIVWYGNFRFLGYNPPFQPVFRRNEIIVSVKWENTAPEVRQ